MKRCITAHEVKAFGAIPEGSLWDDDSPYITDPALFEDVPSCSTCDGSGVIPQAVQDERFLKTEPCPECFPKSKKKKPTRKFGERALVAAETTEEGDSDGS